MTEKRPTAAHPGGAGTFTDAIVAAVERAGGFNKNDQVAPAAVLWTDKERQWEPLLPTLRLRLPVLTFGEYAPAERRGPAYWLLCMIARTLDDKLPSDTIPIIYFPGISRQELRAIEESPKALKPLAELQYRGAFWTHKSGRDWTLVAFLQAAEAGLGIEVASDNATREALQRALLKLADEPVARLKAEAPLRAPFFDNLLNPDEERSILLWLSDPDGYKARVSAQEWGSFRNLVKTKYDVDPETDGPVTAAEYLGKQQGGWSKIWRRYSEAPTAFPKLPFLLRTARPKQLRLLESREPWPQFNEEAEGQLRKQFGELRDKPIPEAQAIVHQLEGEHAPRREWVWAKLGQAPLALALQYVESLAQNTARALGGATVTAVAANYADWGWCVDAAAIDALAAVEHHDDVIAVKAAVASLYRPWLEQAATAFQKAYRSTPAQQAYPISPLPDPTSGTCILFSDALRFDAAQRLAEALKARGFEGTVKWQLAALPPLTPTAKPAISPVAMMFTGAGMPKLEPALRGTTAPVNVNILRKALADNGFQVLQDEDLGDVSGKAWTELGAIDAYGHQHGWKLAQHLGGELRSLEQRVQALLDWGWKQVIVITDHGWLILPGGLSKVELPEHLTVIRKGRAARLKENAQTDQLIAPWFWDGNARIAMAPGISCFEAGKEYEHGGLSPQECVVPVVTVTRASSAPALAVSIDSIKWKGLRCSLLLAGNYANVQVDIRQKAGDPNTSLAVPRTANAEGAVSLLVENEDLAGSAAFVVVLSERDTIVAQQVTTIGE
jgi:hypothetical protein